MNGGLSMVEMKSGYKMTEVGVIPEDWEVKEFNETFSVIPNNSLSRDYLNAQAGEYHDIHYGDVLIKYGALLDAGDTEIPFINKAITDKWVNRRIVTEGDIIMADTAEDNTVGKCSEVINVNHKKIVSGLHTFWLHPNEGLFEKGFLGYFMNHSLYHNQLLPLIHGTKVSSVSKNEILGTRVLVPLKNEQTAIATVLSDVDSLISALTKKIEKKKAIKQGLMQQLLTGKKRLPGFCGDWIKKKVSSVSDILRGGSPRPIENYIVKSGGVNWIKIGDVDSSAKYIFRTNEQIIESGIQYSRFVHSGDLLLSNSMSFGRPYILKTEGCIHDGWLVIQNYGKYFDKEFLYYLLGSDEVLKQYKSLAAGSSVLNLNKDIVGKVVLYFPPSISEQTAIANILSDCDSEIAALEEKRDKYKEIKQGMMQQLLTGKIRLIK